MALPRQGPAAFALAALPALLLLAGPAGIRPAAAQITTLQEAPEVIEAEEPFPFAVIGITGTGSFNTYAMEDVNVAIGIMNRGITQPGVGYSRFGKGASGGGGIRAILMERILVEATWERILASEKVGGPFNHSEFEMPADAYLFTLGWDLMKKRKVAFGIAAGPGYYEAKGQQVITEQPVGRDPQTVGTIEITGNALGGHVGAYFESALAGHVWVNAIAGYRIAKVDDLEVSGFKEMSHAFRPGPQRLPETRSVGSPAVECADCADTNRDGYPDSVPDDAVVTLRGGGTSADWSGFMGRLALTWYFNVPVD